MSAKKLAGTTRRKPRDLGGLRQRAHPILERLDHGGLQRVIHPAPLPTIPKQAGILERLQVKRHEGLASLEGIGEIADTLLAFAEAFQDLQARFVTERPKPSRGLLRILYSNQSSTVLHQSLLISQPVRGRVPQPLGH
jgi:hypothetical protein